MNAKRVLVIESKATSKRGAERLQSEEIAIASFPPRVPNLKSFLGPLLAPLGKLHPAKIFPKSAQATTLGLWK
jgi:hypothetical protein